MLRGVLAAAVLLAMLWVPAGRAAAADGGPFVIVSGPGSGNSTYLPPVAIARARNDLMLVNADPARHDVLAAEHYAPVQCPDEPGMCPEGTPVWCLPQDPSAEWNAVTNLLPYPPGECPLFWSALIGIAESTPVLGTEYLQPGELYPFTCSIHPWMNATLYVLPEPTP